MYYITGWLIWPQDTEPRQRWRLRDWDQLKLRLRECWKLVSVLTELRSRDWKKQWVIDYKIQSIKQFSHSCVACRNLVSLENPAHIFSRFLCLNFRLPHWKISLPLRWGRDSSTSHEAPALGMKSETSAVSWITPWPTSCGINLWIRCFWKQRPGNWMIPWTSNAVIRASPPLAVGWVLGGITEDMAD